MDPKTILVTGATDGIGKQTALELAAMGHQVLLHGRDRRRTQAALDEILSATGNEALEAYTADFGELATVRRLADEVKARHKRLDVLVNNAGVFMGERVLTKDGLETTFQVNHLAPMLLTRLLLDLLKAGAPARIVNVSSATHASAKLNFDNLQGERRYDGFGAYELSKLGNLYFTYQLAPKLAGSGVTVTALHPGGISTKLLRAGWGGGGRSVEQGAQTPVYLAASPEVEGHTGGYYENKRPARSSAASYEEALRERFMAVSWRLIDQVSPEPTRGSAGDG